MVAGYSSKFTFTMVAGMIWSLWFIAQDLPSLGATLFMVVLCYFATDMISGLLHIILDNPRSLDIPFIKPLAEGFQGHHNDPDGIFEMGLYQHLYVMHLPLTLLFIAVLPLHTPLVYVAYLSMVAMLHLMQMSHRWAHVPDDKRSSFVTALQRARFIIPFANHDKHHHPPYERDFCIMSGWCNGPLNVMARAFGVRSHAWMAVFLVACVVPLASGFAISFTRF